MNNVRVVAQTTGPNGRPIRMDRKIVLYNEYAPLDGAVRKALNDRRDKGAPFMGCEIMVMKDGERMASFVYDPDTKRLVRGYQFRKVTVMNNGEKVAAFQVKR